ncbi:dTDP-3-amino-3,6-dideoxy-alpha-D-galactopyranose transaminase [subsurface metagenome]
MNKIIFLMAMIIEYENLFRTNEMFFDEFKETFDKVLNSGWFILGQEVETFEKEFADYNEVDYCIGVASGLDALTLSILALDIEKGSEIIVPSNTYIATLLSILHAGCKPILVEPDLETYNIDPSNIENALTRKTRAVMVVHLYGKVCNMDPIIDICRNNRLFLLEDCAQAHGAEYKGRKAGCFGDMAGFSFYPTKNLGALGDGGAILTNNPDYKMKLSMLRNYGSGKKYYNEYIGLNSRLDELQSAFLRIKLRSLDKINSHKRKLASIYLDELKEDFILPVVDDNYKDVYHIFNIRHPKRDKLRNYLLKQGIKTEIHYPLPPHRQKALSFLSHLGFPISEEIHQTTISLPVSTFHTREDIFRVVEVLNKFGSSGR